MIKKESMSWLQQFFCAGLVVIALAGTASAAEYGFVYDFSTPTVSQFNSGANLVTIDGAGQDDTVVGAPILPIKTARIFVPAEEKPVSIMVTYGATSTIPGSFTIQHATRPYPLSFGGPMVIDPPDPSIYSVDSFFPSVPYATRGFQYLHGAQIVEVDLRPVMFNPVQRLLKYFVQMKVTVKTMPRTRPVGVVPARNTAEDRDTVAATVDNKDEFLRAQPAPLGDTLDSSREYLVITTDALVPALQTLADFRETSAGGEFTTYLETINTIKADYVGVDAAEKVRNFIIDCYTNYGTRYVVLGGDCDGTPDQQAVPTRGVTAYASELDTYIPSDLYFGCLDGTWNRDGDGRWGETTDGINRGDIDWYSEVYVGRIAADTAAEALNQINKIIAYETGSAQPYQTLLVGENLDNEPTWGGDRMDWVYGFMDGMPKTELYDRDWPGNDWPPSELISVVNSDVFGWINHLGHSNNTYNMKLYNEDIASMANDKYFLVYSQGCYSGSIDNRLPKNYTSSDCYAEVITNGYEDRGAYAYIGNSRYGLYNPGDYVSGTSNLAHKEFVEAVFHDNYVRLGEANQRSKLDLPLTGYGSGAYRWIAFELNLLGDPVTPINLGEQTLPPSADFTAYPVIGAPPLAVTFTDRSSGATSWAWVFGDGSTSSQKDPHHTYTDEGVYTVSLTVFNAYGSTTKTIADLITVACLAPEAEFSASPTSGTIPLTVHFTDESNNSPASWSWDFGDGATSTDQNPTHTFQSAGTYTVTLTAANACGSDQETKVNFLVANPPLVNAMHISTITVAKKSWYSYRRAQAQIKVVDQDGNPVANATVKGAWSGASTDTDEFSTDAAGLGSCYSDWVRSEASFTFCVTNVTKTQWTYDPEENVIQCGISN